MIQLKPLEKPLESKPTVLRVYRSINLELSPDKSSWAKLCLKITRVYDSLGGPKPEKVFQSNVFGYGNMEQVRVYPAEFIPVMINIIKDHLEGK